VEEVAVAEEVAEEVAEVATNHHPHVIVLVHQ